MILLVFIITYIYACNMKLSHWYSEGIVDCSILSMAAIILSSFSLLDSYFSATWNSICDHFYDVLCSHAHSHKNIYWFSMLNEELGQRSNLDI